MVILSRIALELALALATIAGPPVAAKPVHRKAAGLSIVIYTGTVNTETAPRLFDLISKSTDKVIGFKLTIERSKEREERYCTSFREGRLVVSAGDPMDDSTELVVNGPIGTTWDMWQVDGFYLIKSGGMHAAGALSWGAMPIDEATIRLNPAIRITTRPF